VESILTSFEREYLKKQLEQSDLHRQLRQRIKIMLLADEGKTQTEICRLLGCSTGTAGQWMLLAKAQMAHKFIEISRGRPKVANDEYKQRLQELVQSAPTEHGYSFRRWTAEWLSKHLTKELGITISARHISRLLRELRLSTMPQTPTIAELEIKGSRITIQNLADESIAKF
jgi:transposase